MQAILDKFRHPDLSGQALTTEIQNLRQIQTQGWNPHLFEGLFANSSHLDELKRNPQHYGRILGDHDPIDANNGIHILLDADRTRILELTPFAFSQLLAHQHQGVPEAKIKTGESVWAFRQRLTQNKDNSSFLRKLWPRVSHSRSTSQIIATSPQVGHIRAVAEKDTPQDQTAVGIECIVGRIHHRNQYSTGWRIRLGLSLC